MHAFTGRLTILSAAASILALAACGPADSASPLVPETSVSDTTDLPSMPSGSLSASSLELGPNGIGSLTLGMSYAEVKKADVILEVDPSAPGAGCEHYDFFDNGQLVGIVGITAERGVETIGVLGGVPTPQGIEAGSTPDDVRRAYPDADLTHVTTGSRTYATVPGNPNATYQFAFNARGVVVGIVLRLNDQACDE